MAKPRFDEETAVLSPDHALRLAKAAYSMLCNGSHESAKQIVGLLIHYLKGEPEE